MYQGQSFKFPRAIYMISLVNPLDKQPSIREYFERKQDALLWELASCASLSTCNSSVIYEYVSPEGIRVSSIRRFFRVVIDGYLEQFSAIPRRRVLSVIYQLSII